MYFLLIPIYLLIAHNSLPLAAKYLAAVSRLLFTGKLKYEEKSAVLLTKLKRGQGKVDILKLSSGVVLPMNFNGLLNFGSELAITSLPQMWELSMLWWCYHVDGQHPPSSVSVIYSSVTLLL